LRHGSDDWAIWLGYFLQKILNQIFIQMKKVLFALVFILISIAAMGQKKTPSVVKAPRYKIVIQLTNSDTAVHRATVKQIFNALTAAPDSRIEVVCHNNGISFLQSAKTFQAENIKSLKAKGVVFMACENTLRERKIEKSEIVPEAGFVPAGIIEVVDKQTKGWAYIKAGF
jgi:uncharacterized protein